MPFLKLFIPEIDQAKHAIFSPTDKLREQWGFRGVLYILNDTLAVWQRIKGFDVIMDTVILLHSELFIGTEYSTIAKFVAWMRRMQGRQSVLQWPLHSHDLLIGIMLIMNREIQHIREHFIHCFTSYGHTAWHWLYFLHQLKLSTSLSPITQAHIHICTDVRP